MDVQVTDNPATHRFEIRADGELAGFTLYRPAETRYTFVHTEIDPRFEGHGLASKLISQVLDTMRERGLSVLPHCPFVRAYIETHHEYLDLVPHELRQAFKLPEAAETSTTD